MAEKERSSSAGAESGKVEKKDVNLQKRNADFSEKDIAEPKEKKTFSMSVTAKPQNKSGISMNFGVKKTQMKIEEAKTGISINTTKGSSAKPGPIKMSLQSQSKESPVALKPKTVKVASVFNEDSEEEEEMPPEAKMKMRNVGRETPTAAGPNSYGKNNLGFCDRNRIIERELQQKILEMSEDK